MSGTRPSCSFNVFYVQYDHVAVHMLRTPWVFPEEAGIALRNVLKPHLACFLTPEHLLLFTFIYMHLGCI